MESRSTGLLLLTLGAGLFAGTTLQLLPVEAFLAGVGCSAVGLLVFMKANRTASQAAEKRHARALHPDIRRRQGAAFAERQPRRMEDLGAASLGGRTRNAAQAATVEALSPPDELLLSDLSIEADSGDSSDEDEEFKISQDVSFPVEVQEHDSIADKLEKLRRLHDEHIITDEEFLTAKAKVLG